MSEMMTACRVMRDVQRRRTGLGRAKEPTDTGEAHLANGARQSGEDQGTNLGLDLLWMQLVSPQLRGRRRARD